jgi:hypothetical protein
LAAALAEALGSLTCLDTSNIDDGDRFPPRLVETILKPACS